MKLKSDAGMFRNDCDDEIEYCLILICSFLIPVTNNNLFLRIVFDDLGQT